MTWGENWVGSPKMKEIKQKLCDARPHEDARFGEGAGGGKRVCCLLMVERKKLRVFGEKNDLQKN